MTAMVMTAMVTTAMATDDDDDDDDDAVDSVDSCGFRGFHGQFLICSFCHGPMGPWAHGPSPEGCPEKNYFICIDR